MPSSHPGALSFICKKILKYNPSRVLDVGVGFGKFGFLAREYTDIWKNKTYRGGWKTIVDGIEIFEEYILPHHNLIYNNIYIGNATTIVSNMITENKKYDLIICCDMIEHITKDVGLKFLEDCSKLSTHLIFTTPIKFFKQDKNLYVTKMGNKNEIHQSLWDKKTMSQFGDVIELGPILILSR